MWCCRRLELMVAGGVADCGCVGKQCRLGSFRVAAVSLCFLSSPSSRYGGHGGLVLPASQGFPLGKPSIFFEPGFLYERLCMFQVRRWGFLSAWQGYGGLALRCNLDGWSSLTVLGGWLGRPPDLGQVGGLST
ncbi:hypothetical protein M0R45_034601 [Rubus argutus]|uniref:Uncharacterized protein n=1 Tax=Rubus argutus TaxID=59490 RepID=A0AAW1VUE0_RUBAR